MKGQTCDIILTRLLRTELSKGKYLLRTDLRANHPIRLLSPHGMVSHYGEAAKRLHVSRLRGCQGVSPAVVNDAGESSAVLLLFKTQDINGQPLFCDRGASDSLTIASCKAQYFFACPIAFSLISVLILSFLLSFQLVITTQ